MVTVHFLPIEPLAERYTEQMLGWVEGGLDQAGATSKTYLPPSPSHIETGEWLDVFGTVGFKARQLETVADAFRAREVQHGDTFLLGDVWFPGVEGIRFMADLAAIKVRIVGWHYAGCFDPADLLATSLGRWGPAYERVLLTEVLDRIFVGSRFHRDLLVGGGAPPDRVEVRGLVWKPSAVEPFRVPESERERIVVFPHRIAPEKQPKVFASLARRLNGYHGYRFLFSTSRPNGPDEYLGVPVVRHATKADYYRFLARCSIFYSAARQETFGYALHEAIALGLGVVAPGRCSYPEMLNHDERFLYDDDDGEELLRAHMAQPVAPPIEWTRRYEIAYHSLLAEIAQ